MDLSDLREKIEKLATLNTQKENLTKRISLLTSYLEIEKSDAVEINLADDKSKLLLIDSAIRAEASKLEQVRRDVGMLVIESLKCLNREIGSFLEGNRSLDALSSLINEIDSTKKDCIDAKEAIAGFKLLDAKIINNPMTTSMPEGVTNLDESKSAPSSFEIWLSKFPELSAYTLRGSSGFSIKAFCLKFRHLLTDDYTHEFGMDKIIKGLCVNKGLNGGLVLKSDQFQAILNQIEPFSTEVDDPPFVSTNQKTKQSLINLSSLKPKLKISRYKFKDDEKFTVVEGWRLFYDSVLSRLSRDYPVAFKKLEQDPTFEFLKKDVSQSSFQIKSRTRHYIGNTWGINNFKYNLMQIFEKLGLDQSTLLIEIYD